MSCLAQHSAGLDAASRQWLQTVGFTGAPDTHVLLPGADGRLQAVWAGVRGADHPFALSALPKALPEGRYRLGDAGFDVDAEAAALSWALGTVAKGSLRKAFDRSVRAIEARHGLTVPPNA